MKKGLLLVSLLAGSSAFGMDIMRNVRLSKVTGDLANGWVDVALYLSGGYALNEWRKNGDAKRSMLDNAENPLTDKYMKWVNMGILKAALDKVDGNDPSLL